MKPTKLTLETDYKINGNSTGCALDTLAIAVDGRDSNDIDEGNMENDYYTEKYVFEQYDFESDMLKSATEAELKIYLKDPFAQACAVADYKEKAIEAVRSREDDTSPLALEVQKAIDEQREQDYKEWIYGDHYNWAGILSIAERKYGDTGNGLDITTEKGEVYAIIPDDTIGIWYDDERISDKTHKAAIEYLEDLINSDARAEYNKRQAENAKRRAERERLQEYKAKQAAEAEEARKAKIQALLDK